MTQLAELYERVYLNALHLKWAIISMFISKKVPFSALHARLKYCRALCDGERTAEHFENVFLAIICIEDSAVSFLFRHQSGRRYQFQLKYEVNRIISSAESIYPYLDNDETKKGVSAYQIDRGLKDYKMLIDRLLVDEPDWSKPKSDLLAYTMISNPKLYRLSGWREMLHWAIVNCYSNKHKDSKPSH